jgi:hypothetical protein
MLNDYEPVDWTVEMGVIEMYTDSGDNLCAWWLLNVGTRNKWRARYELSRLESHDGTTVRDTEVHDGT